MSTYVPCEMSIKREPVVLQVLTEKKGMAKNMKRE